MAPVAKLQQQGPMTQIANGIMSAGEPSRRRAEVGSDKKLVRAALIARWSGSAPAAVAVVCAEGVGRMFTLHVGPAHFKQFPRHKLEELVAVTKELLYILPGRGAQ
jgi:hypothetical protein